MIIISQGVLSTYRVLVFEQYLFVKEQAGWQQQFHTFDTQIILFKKSSFFLISKYSIFTDFNSSLDDSSIYYIVPYSLLSSIVSFGAYFCFKASTIVLSPALIAGLRVTSIESNAASSIYMS